MTDPKALAEKIMQIEGLAFDTGSKNDSCEVARQIESLLAEAMEEEYKRGYAIGREDGEEGGSLR